MNALRSRGFDANSVAGGGGGAVDSVFGRTGVVVADPTDYAAYYGQLAAANSWTGVNTFSGSFIFPPATVTVTANAGTIDITQARSVATNGANLTLTPSGAGTNGQQIGVAVVNSDTAAHTVTGAGSASTISYTMPASSTILTYWQSNGSAWSLVGGPPTTNDLSTIAPASGDLVGSWDISGGVTGKATWATVLALYDSQTATLTNKRNTARVTTITSSATPTVNTDNCDVVSITALAADITSMTTNLSGTANPFDQLEYWIVGTATRAITWGASFSAGPVALPTTTSTTELAWLGVMLPVATVDVSPFGPPFS